MKPFHWSYLIVHMAAASAAALAIALFCCGLFGWLIRFVPVTRLKSAARTAEFLPSLAFAFFGFGPRIVGAFRVPTWLTGNRGLQIAAGAGALILGFTIAGVRCLSMDYLVRVTSMVHADSAAKKRARRHWAWLGPLVGALLGGQVARAGFEFTRRLIVRDWQFRRQLMGLAPSLVMFGGMIGGGWRTSPFSGRFTAMLFLPHAFGFVLLGACPALAYGSDCKAVWTFLLVPQGAFRRFGSGVHAALWTLFIAVPHTVMLCALPFAWGWLDSSIFVAFSMATASLYLALEIRLIDGIPFGKQLQSNRSFYMFGILFLFGISAGIMVVLQYFLIFRSPWAVGIAAFVIAAAACLTARGSLGAFETAMRHSLGTLSGESTLIYREIP